MMNLGDYIEDSTHYFFWPSNDGSGGSITRSTDGTIYIIKDGDYANKVTTGITDVEDVVTGLHKVTMVLTDAYFSAGSDYAVIIEGSVIDSETVNTVLAHFSIENRSQANLEAVMKAITGITEGGTWTWQKAMKIITAWVAGNWRLKAADTTKQELMDAENGTTVILEQSLDESPTAGNNYRDITVKI